MRPPDGGVASVIGVPELKAFLFLVLAVVVAGLIVASIVLAWTRGRR